MKRLKLTIRARLSLLFAVSAVLILLALSCFIYLFTVDYRQKEFRERMQVRLQEADSLLRKNAAYPFMTLDNLPPGTLPEEAFYYRRPMPVITIPDGDRQLSLVPLIEIENKRFHFIEKERRSYLLHFDKTLGNVIVLSAVDVFGYTKIRNMKKVLLIGIILGTLAMGFISWYLPRRELRPLSDKIKKARRIGGESLNLRLNVRNDYDELGLLAITFNQMLDRIEKAFAVQKQFTSNAAHELRNPITAISGEAQLALLQNRSTEEYRLALDRIRAKSDELEKLVDRLLVLSKIETRGVEKSEVRLDEVLLESVASVQSRHPQKANLIRIQITEANGDEYRLHGDAAILQLAVVNVLDNALKYGEEQPVQVSLSLTGQTLRLQISDTGMGVTEEERAKLFELFYRTNGVRHIYGSGIGLPLVKSIVEWHKGQISVESNVPKGMVVSMMFPAIGETAVVPGARNN